MAAPTAGDAAVRVAVARGASRPTAVTRLVALATLTLATFACASPAPPAARAAPFRAVEEWPAGLAVGSTTPGPIPLVGPVTVPVAAGHRYVLALRLRLDEGAVAIRTSGTAEGTAQRIVARLGPYLAFIPALAARDSLEVTVLHVPKQGPVFAEIGGLAIAEVEPSTVDATVEALATSFERETRRSADPAIENLVPNPGFAESDEVRGLPAEWSAYVDTTLDRTTHRLAVRGTPPPGRPYVASGPIRIVSGRRYRAQCRVRVTEGTVSLRIVDYDELHEYGHSEPARPGASFVDLVIEFAAPEGARAARLWAVPVDAGVPATFEVATVQFEELPE